MTSTEQEGVKLVGCSVQGPGHVRDEVPCQDSWAAEQLPGDRLVIAVGDGLGEADLSHKGSEIATSTAVESLTEYLDAAEEIEEESARDAFRVAFEAARDAVREEATRIDEPASELQTTLLAVVVGPSGLAGAVVGDGGIIYQRDDACPLLIDREMKIVDLPASNVTYPLVDDEWPSYRFNYVDDADGVVVFSDGVDAFAFDDLGTANPEFIDGVFEVCREVEDSDEANDKLAEILNDEPFTLVDDDKTVVAGDFMPEYTGAEVETGSGDALVVGDKIDSGADNATHVVDEPDSDSGSESEPSSESDGDAGSDPERTETGSNAREGSHREVMRDVVRLFYSTGDGDALENKISSMTEASPDVQGGDENTASFSWPIDTVESVDGSEFLGYWMQLPKGEDVTDVLKFAKERERPVQQRPSGVLNSALSAIGLDDNDGTPQYTRALSLAQGVHMVHRQGHAIGDLHHSTIHVGADTMVLTDCDSFHISAGETTFEGAEMSERYAPPEESADGIERVQFGDRFALGIHLFQLLMDGYHPYQAEGSAATTGDFCDVIEENPFPYRDPRPGILEPPSDAPAFGELPSDLRTRFSMCFIEGKSVPEMRPSASSWVDALS